MTQDQFIRRFLWISVGFNLGAAVLFAWPSSPLGQLIGLPVPVAPIYSAMLAYFIAMFGGMYGWLAMQVQVHRPMVAFAAIGKAGVFVLLLVFWLAGEAPGLGALLASGDLILAGLYTRWLLKTARA